LNWDEENIPGGYTITKKDYILFLIPGFNQAFLVPAEPNIKRPWPFPDIFPSDEEENDEGKEDKITW